ncbi:MAG: hypothetical protein KBA50_07440 [Sedimentibacter sp.]|jgi:hypothetical protein|nr:hypothetical protein [Sedimentibacter sp.]
MSKKPTFRILFVLVTILVIASMAESNVIGASTSKTLSTNFTLVNLSTTADAQVQVTYLKDDGSIWDADDANETFVIPKNYGIMQIRQYFDNIMSSGKGSAVISSSEDLRAIVQIQARGQVPTQGAYSGFTTGSTKFYVPLVIKNRNTASGFANTQIVVQNLEGTNQVSGTIDLINEDGSLRYSKPFSNLPAGVSLYYDIADEAESNVPSGWYGSAVVNSIGGNVAVVSNFFTGPDAMQSFNAFPQESLSKTWVVPLFFSRLANGLSTVVTVQNLSDSAIPQDGITLTCTKNPNFPGPDTLLVQLPVSLGKSASYSFNPVTDHEMFPDSGWGGSCQIDAGLADIVAIVQMRYVNAPTGFSGAAAYEAIPMSVTDNTEIIPLIAKRLPNGFATVAVIQNFDFVNPATVDLLYTPSKVAMECPINICDINDDGVVDDLDKIMINDVVVPAGGSIQRNHRISGGPESEPSLPDGWQGSLVVISDKPVSGFAQLTNISVLTGDTFMAHNALTTVTAP